VAGTSLQRRRPFDPGVNSTMLVPVILCGGAGTRLWPASRASMPKPFIKVRDSKSLLRLTHDRVSALDGVTQVVAITNVEYGLRVAEELGGAGAELQLLLEPFGRNTAPAVAIAARWVERQHGPDATLLVVPADHVVEPQSEFAAAVAAAHEQAKAGKLVVFGVHPTRPETGYGYVKQGAALGASAFVVERFVEKPPLKEAERMLADGCYTWNSGMFCFKVSAIRAALQKHAPDVLKGAQDAVDSGVARAGTVEFLASAFGALPEVSIDYAVMERATNVAMVPCRFSWSDIGSWKSLADALPADAHGNYAEGKAMVVDSHNTYVRSGGRLVAAIGLQDLVVVETPDAVLVAHKDASQQVKDVVARLKTDGDPVATEHLTVERPWGSFTVLAATDSFKLKRIEVKPHRRLSLQMHQRRSEHWVVIEGTARVTIGDHLFDVPTGESTYVPVRTRHRLENAGETPLVIVEVQCGDYVGEDDIVRFADDFGRVG
jgi:mannose-1-phosphate guanylyltransferase/mannose-6-phosphate isomerase